MTFSSTYFGSNGWLIEFGTLHILVDPWFRGSLTFPPGSWLFEGRLLNEMAIPKRIDLLLLTQGLADHAHPSTLKLLPRSIPVVGSPSAISVVRELGFKTLQELRPGATTQIEDLVIKATAGAFVPNLENGYLLNHHLGSLYIEPHGFLDRAISPRNVDAVITPVINLRLPLVGTFVRGKSILPELIKRFNPKTILSSTIGGDATFNGLLPGLISVEGTINEIVESIDQEIKFIDPIPGMRYTLKNHTC